MTGRRRGAATVAAVCVFTLPVAAIFMGNSAFRMAEITLLVAAISFFFAIIFVGVRARVIVAGLAVMVGLVMASAATAWQTWLSIAGEAVECQILAEREERRSRYGTVLLYSLQCGDQRLDSVQLSVNESAVGDPGDRTTVVLDRYDLAAPGRPENLTRTGLWLLPLSVLLALGFVVYAATRPVEPDSPRRPRGKPEPKPVDQEFL